MLIIRSGNLLCCEIPDPRPFRLLAIAVGESKHIAPDRGLQTGGHFFHPLGGITRLVGIHKKAIPCNVTHPECTGCVAKKAMLFPL